MKIETVRIIQNTLPQPIREEIGRCFAYRFEWTSPDGDKVELDVPTDLFLLNPTILRKTTPFSNCQLDLKAIDSCGRYRFHFKFIEGRHLILLFEKVEFQVFGKELHVISANVTGRGLLPFTSTTVSEEVSQRLPMFSQFIEFRKHELTYL